MNYTKTFGWYYISMEERAPAWTGVEYMYNFLTQNESVGPFGRGATADECEIGDVIQLGREEEGYYHTLLIVGFEGEDILVAAQTDDAFNRALSSYDYDYLRFIKILGVRFDAPSAVDCFEAVYNGIAIIPSAPIQDTPPQVPENLPQMPPESSQPGSEARSDAQSGNTG